MKIGYKSFDADLKCRGFQFNLNENFSKSYVGSLRPCTSDGFHYCNKLEDCFEYYPNNGKNRFCEIEIIGHFKDEGNKSITNAFRIIRELSKEEIDSTYYKKNLHLDLVKSIHVKYPHFIIVGSVGLFLHGVRLDRWKNNSSDIDIVTPYFTLLEKGDGLSSIQNAKDLASGNDFDSTIAVEGVKVDLKIDPHQTYEIVEFQGHRYKVSPLTHILNAKLKYAMNGQEKHLEDIKNMVLNN